MRPLLKPLRIWKCYACLKNIIAPKDKDDPPKKDRRDIDDYTLEPEENDTE